MRTVLVCRDRELSALAERLAQDRPVVVVGEAGVGKTALLRAAAAATGRPTFEGGALATLAWMEHLPLRRALARPVGGDATAVATEVEAVVGRGILILDDLQWSDPLTAETVPMLAGRIAVLAGVRSGDTQSGVALDWLVGSGFEELHLDGLDVGGVAELVSRVRPELVGRGRPELSPAAAARLMSRTGGNPLMVLELALSGEPSANLRLALAARLRRLDAAGREAFGLLALAGRPLAIDDVGGAGVKSLLAADLGLPDGPGLVAVRHSLLAEMAVEMMGEAERRELHARLARLVTDPGEAARHHLQAKENDLAFECALRAAEATERPGERASHLAVAAAVASGPEADELRLRAARALDDAQDWAGMLSLLDRITARDPQTRAWAALLRARSAWIGGDQEALRTSLSEGLALASGSGTEVEVRLRIEQSRLPIFIECDLAEGVRMATAALELARSTGIEQPRAQYLLGTALLVADAPGCEEHLLAAMAGARSSGDTQTEFLAANNLISYHESGGLPARGRDVATEMIERARALGFGYWERGLQVQLVVLDWHLGSCRKVVADAETLLGQPLDVRSRDGLVEALCCALVDLGRFDEAARRVEAAYETAVPDYRGRGNLTWVMAEAALWGGRPLQALHLAEDFLAGPDGDPNLVFGHVTRAWALVDLGRDPGPAAERHPRPLLLAVPQETAALRLLHVGDDEKAAERFDQAARLWAPYHRRGELRCLWAAGEALRRSGDRGSALVRLETVEARAEELDFGSLLVRIRPSLRAAGQRRSAARTIGPQGLSGRERQVLELVAEGLTNAQIAARLGVTRRTVVAQVASASVKLGAGSRGQAAALAKSG